MSISKILEIPVEDIIGFDDNVAFNNFNSKIEQQIGRYILPVEMKKLYEDKIKLLEDKVNYLETELMKKNLK